MNRHEFFSSLIKEVETSLNCFPFLFYFTVWGYDLFNYYVLNIFVYDGPVGVPTENTRLYSVFDPCSSSSGCHLSHKK